MTIKQDYEELERSIRCLEEKISDTLNQIDPFLRNDSLLEGLIENSENIIVLKDRNAVNRFVNKKWEMLTGLNRDQVIGKTDDMLFVRESAEQYFKTDMHVIKTGQTVKTEEKLILPDSVFYFNSVKFPLYDSSGKITGLCGIITDITDRKNAEEALRESEANYHYLYHNAPVALFRAKDSVGFIEVNRFCAEIIGYSSVEECVKEFDPINAWFDQTERKKFLNLLREEGEVNDYETRFSRRDGSVAWVLVSAVYISEKEYIEGMIVDISDRKEMEENLRLSEAVKSKMIANIGDVIAILDKNGFNLFKSPNLEKIFGWKPEERLGLSFFDLVHPDDFDCMMTFFNELLTEPGKMKTTECMYMRKDDAYTWIEFTGVNLLDDPDIKGILVNYRDISERKTAEQTLKESEARFKALHDASFGGLAIHDKGYILVCNQGLSEMTGYSVDELIGMNGLELIAESERKKVLSNILGGSEKPYESFGRRKDGSEYPLRIERRNIPHNGKIVRSTEFRDITEYKKAEEERRKLQEQLVQAQRLESVGRLAGGVAHDYNNMLSVILGYAELALEKTGPSGAVHNELQEILKAARRSADITRHLLAFARKQTIKPKILDLNDIIESMFKILHRLIGEDIDIAWHPGSRMWPVKIDPIQVEQVLTNLCVNSRDAISGVGKVSIETAKITVDEMFCLKHTDALPGEYVVLTVKDNGCGMDEKTLENIFEPFFTTKPLDKGTGLGLATVYGIVKQNSGFIDVLSEPGHGTTISLYFPRYEGVKEGVEGEAQKKIVHGNGEMILLVEDEPLIMSMCKEMLERMGYNVICADKPEKALNLAEEFQGKIDLLITDVVMPEMNGRELSEKLLAVKPGVKVLFMSGYAANVIVHSGLFTEDVVLLNKPFSMAELDEKIREILGTSER